MLQTFTAFPLLFFFGLLILIPQSADAYIDPGSGNLLLQLLLGGVAGLIVIGKLYWYRILALFGLGKNKPE